MKAVQRNQNCHRYRCYALLVLSLEWKVEAVIGGENEVDDCDEVICTR